LAVTATSTNTTTTSTTTGSVTATATGGTTPYTYRWNTGATTATVNNLGVGTYTVTVTDALGCTATASVNVNAGICAGFTTYTQNQWGSNSNNYEPQRSFIGFFSTYFPSPNYLTIGCNNKLRITRPNELDKFLPSSGPSSPLPSGTLTDPGYNYGNTLAGEVMALTLNVFYDSANASFSAATTYLKDQVVVSGTFANMSVRQVLNEANRYLGGCGSSYTSSQLLNATSSINSNYERGTKDEGYLRCPNSPRLNYFGTQPDNGAMIVYPNPTNGNCKISLTGINYGKADVAIFNLLGEIVFTTQVMVDQPTDFTVDVPLKEKGLAPGLYLVRFVQEGKMQESRLMISYQ
jgi:hypothetical protein